MRYVIGHKNPDTDSICASIAYADFIKKWKNEEVIPARLGVLNPETEFVLKKFGFESPVMLDKVEEGQSFTLVDHSSFEESIDGLKENMVEKVIDHHKFKIMFNSPRAIWTEEWGSACTMIALRYKHQEVEISKGIAGLLLSAILSDTVIFKSPTSTSVDKKMAEQLAKIAGIDNLEEYGMEVKKKKADFDNTDARTLIQMDYKEFAVSGKKYSVGQIEVFDEKINSRKDEIVAELEKIKEESGLDFATLMVTNIMKGGTDFWAVGDVSFMEKAFGGKFENNSLYVKGVMSRKKQVVPPIDKALTQG